MPHERWYTGHASQRSVRVSSFNSLVHSHANPHRWSSICRGATLWGLEHSDITYNISTPTVVSRIARYSYGMALSHIYDPAKHLPEDVYLDTAEGVYRAKDQMNWLLKRVRRCTPPKHALTNAHTPAQGEEVEEGRVLRASLYHNVEVGWKDSGIRQFSTNLLYCEEAKPPTRKTSGRSTYLTLY